MATVYIFGDSVVENTEFINLTLSSRDAAAILNPATASVSVIDGDSKLTITNHFDLVVVTIYSTYCQGNETLTISVHAVELQICC